MKVEYNNLYTHFVFTTLNRVPIILEQNQSCSAFSVSKKDIDRVCKYILNQKEHHNKQSYGKEQDEFLKFYQQTLKPIR
jgi:hypothetical protein